MKCGLKLIFHPAFHHRCLPDWHFALKEWQQDWFVWDFHIYSNKWEWCFFFIKRINVYAQFIHLFKADDIFDFQRKREILKFKKLTEMRIIWNSNRVLGFMCSVKYCHYRPQKTVLIRIFNFEWTGGLNIGRCPIIYWHVCIYVEFQLQNFITPTLNLFWKSSNLERILVEIFSSYHCLKLVLK